jgi:hypothetical protein
MWKLLVASLVVNIYEISFRNLLSLAPQPSLEIANENIDIPAVMM